jgi:Na+:H+ antiporter, NhaC family
MKVNSNHTPPRFGQALFPVLILIALIVYGLLIGPLFLNQKPFALEFIFLSGSIVAISQLLWLGYSWDVIMDGVVKKIGKAMPALLILLAIGLVIGSWIVSGTIPMLVYYGIQIIEPAYLYPVAFIVPVIFSTLTGTSWGSVATIGVVLMGVAITSNAELPIVAAAIIGGSFFGDKLSPLSDTTNVAAIAAEVTVYDHIKAMLSTTLPAALFALLFYFLWGMLYPIEGSPESLLITKQTLAEIKNGFHFNYLLLIPPLIVLIGSLKKLPTLAVLVISSVSALLLAFLFQDFSVSIILDSLISGFDTDSLGFKVSENVDALFTRGGIYSLKEPLIITLLVFVFVGTIDQIQAMPTIVNRVFGFVKGKGALVRAALISTGITNAMTSNQYATSFIVGDAFKKKFDDAHVPRNILSRSLEDTGTMLESLVPWHATAVFMVATLGVSVGDYWYWQVFSLANIFIAFLWTYWRK